MEVLVLALMFTIICALPEKEAQVMTINNTRVEMGFIRVVFSSDKGFVH